ncbi:putative transposase [Bradyrhizobium sp. USDA 4486]
MKRARFTEEQIIAVLKEHEAGAKTADLARKHGVSEATIYNWKAKFGGMDVSEAKRLRALEEENGKLKKLLAEQMLMQPHFASSFQKNGRARRQARCGRASAGRHEPVGTPGLLDRGCGSEDDPLSLQSSAGRRSAWPIARSRQRAAVFRLSPPVRPAAAGGRAIGDQPDLPALLRGLTVRKRRARRKAAGTRAPILVEAKPNARWSLDFVHDQFANGRRFRILNIIDDVPKECLGAIPDTSISERVARKLAAIVERRRKPGMIVSDHGTEFTCNAMLAWCKDAAIDWHFSTGKAHAERLRRELHV